MINFISYEAEKQQTQTSLAAKSNNCITYVLLPRAESVLHKSCCKELILNYTSLAAKSKNCITQVLLPRADIVLHKSCCKELILYYTSLAAKS
jgi:hypothetical protein